MDHRLLDYRPSIEALEGPAAVRQRDSAQADVLRQAAELLEQADAGALDTYLREMIDRVGAGADRALRDALAADLARVGRPLLRQGGAGPRGAAGQVFGLELEGLSPEDQAFEVARHFARFATDAGRWLGRSRRPGPPQAAARRAIANAARRYAPGLQPAAAREGRGTGTWFRRGRQLIVLNP